MTFFFSPDLSAEVEIPKDGILSRTIHDDGVDKTVVFAFSAGQELSSHSAPVAADVFIARGRAILELGGERREAGTLAFAHMAPGLEHSVKAVEDLVMVLCMHRR
ncbi:MAG: cupin domain-containing protein [Planctomycetota bacterium]